MGNRFHTGQLEVERQNPAVAANHVQVHHSSLTVSMRTNIKYSNFLHGTRFICNLTDENSKHIIHTDGIFPKVLCIYLMHPSGEEPTDTSGRKKGNLRRVSGGIFCLRYSSAVLLFYQCTGEASAAHYHTVPGCRVPWSLHAHLAGRIKVEPCRPLRKAFATIISPSLPLSNLKT